MDKIIKYLKSTIASVLALVLCFELICPDALSVYADELGNVISNDNMLSDQILETEIGDAVITIEGEMPENAYMTVAPVTSFDRIDNIINDDGRELAVFVSQIGYDISLYSEDGVLYQPVDNESVVKVTIDDPAIEDIPDAEVYRIDDFVDEATEMVVIERYEDSVSFETEHFTVFTIGSRSYTIDESKPYSVLDSGQNFNKKIKKLVNSSCNDYRNTDDTITNIEWVDTAFTSDTDLAISGQGFTPVYARLNGTVIELYTDAERVYFNGDCQDMFLGMHELVSVDMLKDKIDTSNTSYMGRMFSDCRKLESVDLGRFDTSEVISMSSMFYQCFALTELDFSTFDTNKLVYMDGMFESCWNLTWLDLSDFNTPSLKSVRNLFLRCNVLRSVDMSRFDFSNLPAGEEEMYLPNTLRRFKAPAIIGDVDINLPSIADKHWYIDDEEPHPVPDDYSTYEKCIKDSDQSHTYICTLAPSFIVTVPAQIAISSTNYKTFSGGGTVRVSLTSDADDFHVHVCPENAVLLTNEYDETASIGVGITKDDFSLPDMPGDGSTKSESAQLNVAGNIGRVGEYAGIFNIVISSDYVEHSINLDFDGGDTDDPVPTTYTSRTGDITLPIPKREHYDFIGWSDGEKNLGINVTIPYDTCADINYTALWKLHDYKLTYNLNGQGATATNPATYTIEDTFKLNNPTRPGYTFTGWSGTDLEGDENIEVTLAKGSSGDRSYTAHWSANDDTAYKVHHEQQQLDGSYLLIETDNLTGTTDTEVEPDTKEYEGFTSPAKQKINIDGDGKKEITYRYTRNRYDVTVNKGEGISAVTGSGRYQYGESVTVGYTLVRGYKFIDWTGDKTTTTFTMPAGDVNMTANAELIEYTVIYDANGGNGDNVTQTVAFTATGTRTDEVAKVYSYEDCGFTKVNHRFVGWSLSSDGSADYLPGQNHTYTSGSVINNIYGKEPEDVIDEPIVLYAIYETSYTASDKEGYYLITGTSQKGSDSEYKHWHLTNEDTIDTVDPTVTTAQGQSGVKFSGVFYIGDTVDGIDVKRDAEKSTKPHTYNNK